jgi:hypothetical protein
MATVQTQDVLPVHSRVSWSAIFAGAITALAVYLLLSVLGVALGLSVSGTVGSTELGVGAAIWAVITTLLALFLGGWITSQCTVGENRMEAVIYGVILWGLVFAILLWLMASGVRLGFNAVIGLASATPGAVRTADRLTEEDLRAAGFTQGQIDNFKEQFHQLRARVQELPAGRGDVNWAAQSATAAWWTFGGILLSMLAAVGGAVAGAGPNLMLTGFGLRTTVTGVSYRSRESANR